MYDMAIAHALLRQVASGEFDDVLRVHVPARRAVVFGRQDTRLPGFPAAIAAAEEAGFAPAVRGTGGRAVAYTEKAVVVDRVCREPNAVRSQDARFETYASLFVRLLRELGVDARMGAVAGEYCPGAHSVNARGSVKLVGTSQRVVRDAWLFSALVAVGDSEPVGSVLHEVYTALGQPFDPASVGSLDDEVPGATAEGLIASVVSLLRPDQTERLHLPARTVALARELLPQHRAARGRAGLLPLPPRHPIS